MLKSNEYTKEYNEGVFAFEDGKFHSDCPYDNKIQKDLWIEGYNDAFMEGEAIKYEWDKN